MPDDDYPLISITGHQFQHCHTGSMTRHSVTLDAIEPDPVVIIHPEDLTILGIEAGKLITIESCRGKITVSACIDMGIQRGSLFIAFCYNEARANRKS
jgi:formate dehydrogenase major subunit